MEFEENATVETKDISMFSRKDTSKNLTKYQFITPYQYIYPTGSYFRVFDGIENHKFTITANTTPSELVSILNQLNVGIWSLYKSNATDGNIFYKDAL